MTRHLNDIPYFSQHDNDSDWNSGPWNECSFTCMAMALYALGVRGNGLGKIADQIERAYEQMGFRRGDPIAMADFVNREYGAIGIRDDFAFTKTHADIVGAVQNGYPCILHTDLTQSGHVITIVGDDMNAYGGTGAFVVHDPWGEWFASGYNTTLSGAFLDYSYGLIDRVAGPDGNYWLHILSRE